MAQYVRSHQYFLALHRKFKVASNDIGRKTESFVSAVEFSVIWKTRFSYAVGAFERLLPNKKAPVDVVNDREVLGKSVSNSSATAKDAFAQFISDVENRWFFNYFELAVKILTPVRVYLRLWYKYSMALSRVVITTADLGRQVNSDNFSLVVRSVRRRPLCYSRDSPRRWHAGCRRSPCFRFRFS